MRRCILIINSSDYFSLSDENISPRETSPFGCPKGEIQASLEEGLQKKGGGKGRGFTSLRTLWREYWHEKGGAANS